MHHLITPASVEPVTVTELAWNLRLTTDKNTEYTGVDADYLAMLISAARNDAEHHTGRFWAVQTLECRFRAFQTVLSLTSSLREVKQVSYLDADAEQEQLVATEYYLPVFGYAECGLEFRKHFQPPLIALRDDALRVRFEVGPPSVSNGLYVPPTVKQAIMMLASHWYEHRESVSQSSQSVALTYEWLLGSHVIYGVS